MLRAPLSGASAPLAGRPAISSGCDASTGKTPSREVGGRVGSKIAPEMNFNDIFDANPQEAYPDLVAHLRKS